MRHHFAVEPGICELAASGLIVVRLHLDSNTHALAAVLSRPRSSFANGIVPAELAIAEIVIEMC